MSWNEKGFSLAELVVNLTLITLVAAIGVPPALELASGLRLHLAAQELGGTLRLARSEAARRGFNVAVKFRPGTAGGTTYTLYRDGNGNGVLNADINSGADPAVSQPRPLQYLGSRMHFGFPAGRRVRDPSAPRQWLSDQDPIRFNDSDLASFSPLGTSTPGSVYVTDGKSRLMAVRVTGRTGRMRIIVYDFEEEVWR
jgi:type II secretory pathway pseudopilin PulG